MGNVNTQDGAGWTKLHHAARAGQYKEIKRLVERGAHLNIRDKYGVNTAVMWAATWGHEDIVEYLHQAGADINIKKNDGWTAHWCKYNAVITFTYTNLLCMS